MNSSDSSIKSLYLKNNSNGYWIYLYRVKINLSVHSEDIFKNKLTSSELFGA